MGGARAGSGKRIPATGMGNIVQFENVGLRYRTGPEPLIDVAFSLAAGGFYFLTGQSGAGKTSLPRPLQTIAAGME